MCNNCLIDSQLFYGHVMKIRLYVCVNHFSLLFDGCTIASYDSSNLWGLFSYKPCSELEIEGSVVYLYENDFSSLDFFK